METKVPARRTAVPLPGAAVKWLLAAGTAALFLGGLPVNAAPQRQIAAARQDTTRGTIHTVRKGDTLWDLSARYLNSPWVWPRVFEANQRVIENPHLIYPGQRIWFPVGGGAPIVLSFEEVWPGPETERAEIARQAQAVPAPVKPATPPAAPPPEVEKAAGGLTVAGFSVQEKKYVPLASESAILAAGYIGEPREWPEGRIFEGGGVELNMSMYSQVFLDVGEDDAQVGDLFLVVERGPKVRHPEWGHYLGRKIRVKGIIRIVDVAGRTSRGELIAIFDSVRRKDRVIPAPVVDSRPWKQFVPVQGGRTGFVVARASEEGNLHPYDMLFIDGGIEEGVKVGDLYTIERPERVRGRLRFFEEELGRAVVIAVQEATATAMILELRTSDVKPGEKVRLVGRSVFATSSGGGD